MTNRVSLLCIVITLAALLALPISELVIGDRHLDDPANATIIRPALWLLITGAISIATLVVAIVLTIYVAMGDSMSLIYLELIRIASSLFTIIWTIIGAISLWRDNPDCQGELRDMMWASVIIHLISVAILVFGRSES